MPPPDVPFCPGSGRDATNVTASEAGPRGQCPECGDHLPAIRTFRREAGGDRALTRVVTHAAPRPAAVMLTDEDTSPVTEACDDLLRVELARCASQFAGLGEDLRRIADRLTPPETRPATPQSDVVRARLMTDDVRDRLVAAGTWCPGVDLCAGDEVDGLDPAVCPLCNEVAPTYVSVPGNVRRMGQHPPPADPPNHDPSATPFVPGPEYATFTVPDPPTFDVSDAYGLTPVQHEAGRVRATALELLLRLVNAGVLVPNGVDGWLVETPSPGADTITYRPHVELLDNIARLETETPRDEDLVTVPRAHLDELGASITRLSLSADLLRRLCEYGTVYLENKTAKPRVYGYGQGYQVLERDEADLLLELARRIPPACPAGCGCRYSNDPDARECGCDGQCATDEWVTLAGGAGFRPQNPKD